MIEKTKAQVPPGFRFHPTDEELITHYLQKKVLFPDKFELDHVIREVDLNKLEPWDLREKCKDVHCHSEWYFFSHKDKKYPTGTRTNRATKAGFWKATGRDKAVFSSKNTSNDIGTNGVQHIGMRKTLVFYKGRAPHGLKTDWIMHEYRLHDSSPNPISKQPKEDGWVVCRVFKKRNYEDRSYSYDEQASLSDEEQSDVITKANKETKVGKEPKVDQTQCSNQSKTLEMNNQTLVIPCKQEQVEGDDDVSHLKHSSFLQLPQLESPQPDTVVNENDLLKTESCEESKAHQKAHQATQDYHSEMQGVPNVKPLFMMEDDLNNYMEPSTGHISECWNLYENLVRLNGIETITSIFNYQHPLDFNRFQTQNDNHPSNCEIELWSFPK